MNLATYDAFRHLGLQHFDCARKSEVPSCSVMGVDIKEDDDKVIIKADLPGMEQKDIGVNVENGVLTLSGERKFAKEEKRDDYHHVERSYGKFSRSFRVPTTIDVTNVQAAYKNGELEVTLPKAPESKPRSIEVKVH